MVEGFIRWCKKGDVGLSQRASVTDVEEEEVTGLYDGFYVKTHQLMQLTADDINKYL